MTLCELEQTGFFGWPDIASWMIGAFGLGFLIAWRMLNGLHRVELLAALEIGRREGRQR
jgi:hypothetical protein